MIKNIDSLVGWGKNPRAIKHEDFERLKEQIKRLGIYKPLMVTPAGVVLGGNMRLAALKELGHKEVWVNVVTPKDEAEELEIALAHNDEISKYDDDRLLQMLKNLPDFPKDLFKIDLTAGKSLQQIINRFAPSENAHEDQAGSPYDDGTGEGTIRKFIITFGNEDYRECMERLQKVIQKYGLRNNTEAILRLLQNHA